MYKPGDRVLFYKKGKAYTAEIKNVYDDEKVTEYHMTTQNGNTFKGVYYKTTNEYMIYEKPYNL